MLFDCKFVRCTIAQNLASKFQISYREGVKQCKNPVIRQMTVYKRFLKKNEYIERSFTSLVVTMNKGRIDLKY